MVPCYYFALSDLRCCFTTRALGSMTFARAAQAEILANYRRLEETSGIAPGRIVRAQLDNGTEVARVDEDDAGRGVLKDIGRLKGVDALYTNTPGLYIALTTADCFPLILHDSRSQAVGIAHCGWRGIVGRLEQKLLAAMARDFGTEVQDVVAVIGPGIRICCYSQHDDGLRTAFAGYNQMDLISENSDGTYSIDIALALRSNLFELGITNIVDTNLCTGCGLEFFSARREGFTTGRMLNLAAIRQ